MAKIIALDIGGKRTGIAETDPLQMIASPKETVATADLQDYLTKWLAAEPIEAIVLGEPLALDGGDSHNSQRVRDWHKKLLKLFPEVKLVLQDERFSSKLALQAQIQSGMKKKKRREKGSLDPISAAIILNDYLQNT
ncbi:MAG: Holliday junction resolvase RuvX [Croceimicrobium sp.]|nr:Holliday junction resolvase RuvX [Bacteroidota bacterium]